MGNTLKTGGKLEGRTVLKSVSFSIFQDVCRTPYSIRFLEVLFCNLLNKSGIGFRKFMVKIDKFYGICCRLLSRVESAISKGMLSNKVYIDPIFLLIWEVDMKILNGRKTLLLVSFVEILIFIGMVMALGFTFGGIR